MKQLMLAIAAVIFITVGSTAQNNQIPLIGSEAPSFKAMSTNGKINFPDDFGKQWKILFSHPADFTPVCTSELLELAYLQPKFKELGVECAVISRDGVETHKLWVKQLEGLDYRNRGPQAIEFPLIEDTQLKVSEKYGMLHKPTSTNRDIRGVFIIDGNNIVRSVNFYPMEVGRNMNEIVRLIEAIQTTDESMVYTPANWEKGDDVILPYYPFSKAESDLSAEEKEGYYPMGNRVWFKEVSKDK
ncbi:redoxin domain-containing protein [Maribellus mangrovi]|uniref:redoxin domain-containing protein n=1 Tax=Maribellus mangrovi TaxID=3133146 RepID=UPI0030ECA1C9